MRNVNLFLFKSGWLNLLIIGVFFSFSSLSAQTTLISPSGNGGFENGATFLANGWSESSGTNNPWFVGSVISDGLITGNSAYITNDGGTTNAYTPTNNATNFFWRDVTVPAGETKIILTFNWRQQGEDTWDIWQVFTAPTTVMPSGSNTHPGSGNTNVPSAISGATYLGNGSLISGVQTATYSLPAALAGTTFRLIFSWKNETGGTQPPAAIDNISLISDVPGNFISATSGDWNVGSTWIGGIAPTSLDNATISTGHTVTINASSLAIANLIVDGTLQYGTTPSSFNVNGILTVNTGGTFNVFQSTTGKTLNVAGNITNDGTIDISVGTTSAGSLTLNGTTVQTVGGAGSFNTNVIRNLTCSNTNTSTPNIVWNFNNVKIANNLNLTGARIQLNGNKITHGNGAAVGTLTAPAGTGFLPGGKYARWWTNAQTGTTITAGSDPANTAGTALSRYPFLNSTGQNRAMYISRSSSTTTGNTAGELAVVYNDAATMTTGLTVMDGAYTITDRYDGNWTITAEAGYVYVSGTHLVNLQATNAYFPANGNSRVMNAAATVGTHQNGTTTPGAQRTSLSTAQLTAGSLYMGINAADVPFLSVATGNWNDPTKWNKGTVPTCSDVVTILTGHNITVNSAANVSKNVTINSGGTLTVASGDLTVGCTLNNNALTNNGTLSVSGGTLNVNGNIICSSGSTFNHSSGDINVDGNDNGNATNSVASGTSIVQLNSQNINWTGGTLTIIDPHANSTASNSFAYNNSTAHVNVTTGHTIRFGDGISTQSGGNATNGFRLTTWVGSNRISFNNVVINTGLGTNRYVTSQYSFGINGGLTINADSEFRPGTIVYCNGNLTNNGTATLTSTLILASFLSGTETASSSAQSISGIGTFRNLASSPTANTTSFTINNNNAAGITLNIPLSVSGTLTLTLGVVNTTSTNILSLGTATVAGTLSGGSATAYINGPFARTFAASRTASGTYNATTLFPVGKSATSSYLPIHVDPTTNAGGPTIFKGEAFTSNSGTFGSGVSTLSSTRWEALPISGSANLTNSFIRLTDGAILASNKILQSATASGAYGSIAPVSTYSAGPPATLTTATSLLVASYNGYFAYGDITPCTVPTNQPTGLTFSNLGGASLTGTFTAATSNPSHYLVVRYPNLATVTDPVDFTQYTLGTTLGAGIVIGVLTSPIVTFNDSGLSPGTTYDYYIYSYNNSACNGPVYLISSPLKASVTTCAATTAIPGTPAASAIGISSFTASWIASSTPGVNYLIYVATDLGFTNFVGVYNGLNVGMILSTPVTGLSGNTTYYVRVRADLAGCISDPSSILTVTTECNSTTSFPVTEPFTTYLPSTCWKEGDLGNLTVGPSIISATTSSWIADGFLNVGTSGAAKINIDAASDNDWLISPFFTIPASGYRIKYDVGATQWNATTAPTTPWEADDFVELVVSTGTTNWTVLKTYNSTNVPSHLGQLDVIDISAYNGQTVRFAFRGVEGASDGAADIDFFIDNFVIELAPTDAVDWGNLQFPGSGAIYSTNAFDTYGQTYEPGVTEGAGQGTGVLAWLGYNTADTDPNTWTNWIPATFNVQVVNNDEFIGTIPENTLTPGTYYYAYRYQLSGGPFVYGGYKASGGGIWDGSNNVSGVLTVNACPSVSASATMTTICQNTSTTISASSANPNYTYQWNPGSLVGASHLVSPSSSTSYVVTATDLGIACTSTASVSVNVVPGPSNVTANASPATICVGGSTNLLGDANPNTVLLSESFESGLPSGWSVVNGGTGNNWTFSSSPTGGARTGTRVAQYLYNSSNDANTWLFTSPVNLTAGVTYTIASWYKTFGAFYPEKLKVTVGNAPNIAAQTTTIIDLGTITNDVFLEQSNSFTPLISGTYYFAWNAYSDADQFYINVDDISITTPAILSYSWTSTPSGFTSMSQNPTGIAPLVNTLYNLSVTDSNTGCANTASVNVQFATSAIVSSSADSGAGTLRAAIECLGEGGTITYDQPTTAATVLTTPLNITKSVTIQGLSSASRPEITVPAAGVSIDATKTLTLQNVDVKSSGTATFSGAGDVSITGTTVGKQ